MQNYDQYTKPSSAVDINTELTVRELQSWPEPVNLIEKSDEEIDVTPTPEQQLWSGVMRQNPLEFLPLSVRAHNCLAKSDIDSMFLLVTSTREELLEIPKLGKKTVDEIQDVLADVGLFLPEVPIR